MPRRGSYSLAPKSWRSSSETPLGDERLMYLNTAFVRVHQGLQAVLLLLAERGVIGDSASHHSEAWWVEFAIAINALTNDAGFVEKMKDAATF